MDVIELWNGRHACLLQSALRLTNEQFAARLGIAVRTVAAWHADPAVVPRKEIQQLLDTVHEKAPPTARQRFALLVSLNAAHPHRAQQVRRPCVSRSPSSYVTARCCSSAGETMTQRASAGSSRRA